MEERMEVTARFDGEGHYAIADRGTTVVPGPGPLPAPPVLFLGSLAACAGAYAVAYLRARKLPFAGLSVRVEAERAESPHRLDGIRLWVELPEPVQPRHLVLLQRSVDLCTIKSTMLYAGAVATEVVAPARAA